MSKTSERRQSMRLSHISSVLLAGLIALGTAALGFATSAATLTGTVTDSSGKVVPQAAVTASNVETNIASATVTDTSGLYVIPDLPPGTYQVAVKKDGFKSIVRPNVALHTDSVTEMNFSMQVGALAQTVMVESGAP